MSLEGALNLISTGAAVVDDDVDVVGGAPKSAKKLTKRKNLSAV